jgi:hypothetical protein
MAAATDTEAAHLPYRAVRSAYRRGVQGPLFKRELARAARGQRELTEFLVERQGNKVVRGPFKGMSYHSDADAEGCLPPKLMGFYELELGDLMIQLTDRPWRRIIDVGCAAGYYTTGFARAVPKANVHGFDIDTDKQRLARTAADMNNVADRVSIAGICDHGTLQSLTGADCLLIVDIEGGEDQLLEPRLVPSLAATTLLVELHDFVDAGISGRLITRFSPSHTIEMIDAARREPTRFPELEAIPRRLRAWAVDERRPPGMQWAFLTPR